MNENTKTITAWLNEQLGCPYIYGGTGRTCTPDYRRTQMKAYAKYADLIVANCQQLKSKTCTTCKGCKWAIDGKGRLAYDCAQLVRFAMKTIGIAMVSGAHSQWLKTAFVTTGEIKDMPRDMMCIAYRKDSDGKMHHTVMYLGDGTVIHAKGHNYGVVKERLENVELTHYAIPSGLYTNAELWGRGIDPGLNLPTLRRSSSGKLVEELQRKLGGLTVDGVFGQKTETAVEAYQKAHKLTVDGVVGPKTWAALGYAPEAAPVAPAAPDTEPEAPDDEEETVRVPKRMLEVWAETLEDMAADIRGYAGGG